MCPRKCQQPGARNILKSDVTLMKVIQRRLFQNYLSNTYGTSRVGWSDRRKTVEQKSKVWKGFLKTGLMTLLMLNTGNFDLIVEMKSSPASMNIQAKPLLIGTPVGKGDTALTRKCQAGSLEQKKGTSVIDCLWE